MQPRVVDEPTVRMKRRIQFEGVRIGALACVDPPIRITSAELCTRLSPTLEIGPALDYRIDEGEHRMVAVGLGESIDLDGWCRGHGHSLQP